MRPMMSPNAGSIASRVPKAVCVMRRSASISRPNEMTGVSKAMPAARRMIGRVRVPAITEGTPMMVVTTAAMGIV
jgi:hypothetical protein